MKEQERKQIMEQEELKKECLEYFRARQVYQKLFEGMRKKYAGLGPLGGTVTLAGLTGEERQQLGGFFQKDYTENKTVTISGRLMEKLCLPAALQESPGRRSWRRISGSLWK